MKLHRFRDNAVKTVAARAEKQGYIPDRTNPVRGLISDKKLTRKQAQQRQPFADDELLTVLGSPPFLKQRKERPEWRLKELTGVGNQAMRAHEGLAVCLWLRWSGKVTREERAGRIKRTDVRWSPCPVM